MKNPVSTRFTRSALTLAMATALPLSNAVAQDAQQLPTAKATAQTEDSYKVDNSTSVKYTQPLLDTAKSITVIPASVMRDRNVNSLRDALRNVPGISMAAGEGGAPTGDSMTIRGFDATDDITIDGVRDIAGYTRDVYNVEAVEVAKGPGSAVYGRGSTGGNINLQSKTAKLDDFVDVGLSLGTASDYRAKVDANITLGETTALRINALSDDGGVAGRDEVENSTNAIALSLATGIQTKSRFSVQAEYQVQDNLPDYGLPWVTNYSGRDDRILTDELASLEGLAPNVDFSNFYGSVERDFEDITAQSITLKYEYDLNENTILRALARTGSVERLSIVNAPRFTYVTNDEGVRVYGDGDQVTLGGEKTRDTLDSLTVVQFDVLGQYQTGDILHDVVAGTEFYSQQFERWNFDDDGSDNFDTTPVTVDLINPNNTVAYTGTYTRTGKDQDATGNTTAFYVFDTMTFNPQWELSIGLRYDMFDTELSDGISDDEPLNYTTEDNIFSWSTGLVYKPTPSSSIYFGAGTSANPAAEDLTVGTNGNADTIDPETTTSYELGAKWELYEGKLFASAAIFRTDKKNVYTDAADDFFAEDDGNFNTLNGHQRVDGLELSIAGQVTDELSITAGYTFQDGTVINAENDDATDIGNELPRVAEHSYSIWARYDLSDQVAFGFGTQYMGERYNNAEVAARETAEDYLIFDMMASYQINDKWSAQLNGSNLTDEEYVDQIGGGHFIPGAGRYFSVSTTYSF